MCISVYVCLCLCVSVWVQACRLSGSVFVCSTYDIHMIYVCTHIHLSARYTSVSCKCVSVIKNNKAFVFCTHI